MRPQRLSDRLLTPITQPTPAFMPQIVAESGKSYLAEYPLAKAYGWKAPKHDTGGILYLYPPRGSATRIAPSSGEEAEFKYLKRARPHALNPDDLHRIEIHEGGHPRTNASNRPKRGSSSS